MSVDQRLRQAFADLEAPTLPEVNAAMDRVLAAERRGRVRRRAALASGVAAAVATGAVLWGVQPMGSDTPAPAPASPDPTASSQGPLTGRWSTEPITRATVRAHLATLGLGRYADRVVSDLPGGRFRLRLYVSSAGEWVLWAWGPGRKEVYYDHERPTTNGDLLSLDPLGTSFEGGTTYEMAHTGTTLALTFVETDEPVTDGVPGAVWHQAFYTVAPFHRD